MTLGEMLTAHWLAAKMAESRVLTLDEWHASQGVIPVVEPVVDTLWGFEFICKHPAVDKEGVCDECGLRIGTDRERALHNAVMALRRQS